MTPLSNVNDPSSSNKNGRGGVGEEVVVSPQQVNPNDPDWKTRIRHKQQRLLLLHHSSKCSCEVGKCKVTPLCIEMKNLWDHMTRCNDNECRVPHCLSSKSILIHYRKCQDRKCPVCAPVRETLRKMRKGSRGLIPQGPHIDNQSLIWTKDQEIASKNKRIRSLQAQLRNANNNMACIQDILNPINLTDDMDDPEPSAKRSRLGEEMLSSHLSIQHESTTKKLFKLIKEKVEAEGRAITIEQEKKVAESALSEVKEDLEVTKELTMQQQTLATIILQGRIDELVQVARVAGANESVLLGIKNRSLASGR